MLNNKNLLLLIYSYYMVLAPCLSYFIGNSDLLRRKKKHIFAEHMLDKTAF